VVQRYTGLDRAHGGEEHVIRLEVVKLTEAKRGFVLLPRRWVVERSLASASRIRCLARDREPLPETVAGLQLLVFACLMLAKAAPLLQCTGLALKPTNAWSLQHRGRSGRSRSPNGPRQAAEGQEWPYVS
jgi:hypothetical protein